MSGKSWIHLLLIVATGAAVWHWRDDLRRTLTPPPAAVQRPAAGPPRAVEVEVARVREDVIESTVETVGSLRANESLFIRPEVSGRVAGIEFDEGEDVARGAVLVTLDDAVDRAEVARAEASLGLSRLDFERAEELLKRGVGSKDDRDRKFAQMRIDEAAVQLARARLAKMTILAPFDGMLGLRRVSPGDYVSDGQDIVDLVDIDPIKVDFRVPEVFLSALGVGQQLGITVDALPGEIYRGEVYAIDPQVDVNGRSILIRALVDNPELKLRPGLFARITLVTDRREDALLVPQSAIVPLGDKQFVYRLDDGAVALTEVRTGYRQSQRVEILDGLAAGDAVVVAGQIKLQDGARVEATEVDAQ